MTKIAACIIAYQAEKHIVELLDSLKGNVDYLVVGIDKKTTDNTEAEILKWAESHPEVSALTFPFSLNDDFAAARNLTFSKVPDDTDWITWVDTDDVFDGNRNLYELLESLPRDVGVVWAPYLYSRIWPGGPVNTVFDRERFFRKAANPKWFGRVHELCELKVAGYKKYRTEEVWVDHKNISGDPRTERNLRILDIMRKENPGDSRAVLYTAHQYYAQADHKKDPEIWALAADWYDKFINMHSPGEVLDEKWQALIFSCHARRNAGDLMGSIKAAGAAVQFCPQYADGWHELAHSYAVLRKYDKAIEFHETALTKKQPDRIMVSNPLAYSFDPYNTMYKVYFQMGDHSKALSYITKCLEIMPNSQEHRWWGQNILWHKTRKEAISAQLASVRYLLDTNQPLQAEKVIEGLPAGAAEEEPEVELARKEIAERVAFLRDPDALENMYMKHEETVSAVEILKDKPLEEARTFYPRMTWTVDQLLKLGKGTVLEVGIGNGVQAFLEVMHGFKVIGLDIDPVRVKECNKAAAALGFVETREAPEYTTAPPKHTHDAACADHRSFCKPDCAEEHTCNLVEHEHEMWNADCETCGPVLRLPVLSKESRVQFHYIRPGQSLKERLTQLGLLEEIEMVTATEILEHLEDVESFIQNIEELGKPIVITTPDFAYPGFQETNELHVRGWSQKELEATFAKRGAISQSTKIDHGLGFQTQLGLVYTPGVSYQDRPPVAIFCGPGFERWTPDSVDATGLGGSETAVVYVAKEMAKMNLRVIVFGEAEGVWDGVAYRHYTKWKPTTALWTFISWRHPDVFDAPIAAENKFYWVHDVDQGAHVTEERMKQVNAVLCLSEFHRKHLTKKYPYLKDKLIIVGNGIDPDKFPVLGEARGNRIVYTSSPDRGLEQALTYWPDIKAAVPDAEFHIYYGWDNYDKMGGSLAFKRKIQALAKQEGVVWHGRMGQNQLYKELSRSNVLFYPGPHPFEETFCISVLEAAACGATPVTRANGALSETNIYGRVIHDGRTRDLAAAYLYALKSALRTKDSRRIEMAAKAKERTWRRVTERIVAKMMTLTRASMETATAAD